MGSVLTIRPLERRHIPLVTDWARAEGFTPGAGDVAIYRHTDRQGLWLGWLGQEPVGCIAGVRYNAAYGFLGLFLVRPVHRGRGYGVALWRHALDHLADLRCIGLEAAPERAHDYAGWGFAPASTTTRWQLIRESHRSDSHTDTDTSGGFGGPEPRLLEGAAIPAAAVQAYDAQREPSPRPHFLADWLQHPAGTVLALVDGEGRCHGFGRIRPCLLRRGEGWRVGPLLAGSPALAGQLLAGLIHRHPGVVLIDAPGANPAAAALLEGLGFRPLSRTLRMYRGTAPTVPLSDVYGLACLELG
ncbi:GNAT family N-acetyltransferase [Cyanobium sp. ATX 6A2]|uniref:GNAT family N-acetyltransferase n=1 Tax=Cyanobium sp. ATX 6A2 TaxID=2823700 RepID=UPI0020CE47A6|nr:GNAT family N-acetyltransferase [Cyanobium sp. ATX 6A2]MCP9886864.1 GNAT family N-acetyltransferase [Cyanobium sp. ATX 6A2]